MGKKLTKVRHKLISESEKRHGMFHLLFGVFAYTIGYLSEPEFFSTHIASLFIIAMLGSYLPDIDHVFYIFGYGRKKEYALICRKYLKKLDIAGFLTHVKQTHKNITGIYSHNAGSLVLVIYFTIYTFVERNNISASLFFLSWSFHYIYDILEDILFFKRPNKNWFFIFNRN